MKKLISLSLVFLFTLGGASLYSQQEQPPADKYVSREEYEKLKSELETLKAQMAELVKSRASQAPAEVPSGEFKAVAAASPPSEIEELREEVAKIKETAEASRPGESKFLVTGLGFVQFTNRADGTSAFSAQVSPTLLYKPYDRIFFEAEPEFKLTGSEFEVELEQAHLSYILNDYITLDAGQFLNPANYYGERLHQVWIRKTPDKALALANDSGDVLPQEHLGFQVRGGIPVGPTQFGYAFFVVNAPTLVTDNPKEAGELDFDNFGNSGNHVAVGGRVGFQPIPQLEIGYGFEVDRARATDTTDRDVDGLLQTVDFNYVLDSELVKGFVDLKAQWAWSHVDRTTYDPTGALGFGPVSFNNNRSGGYAQLAYRPTHVDWKFLRDFEPYFRYDKLDRPSGAPNQVDEQRYTMGLNYWLAPSCVFKIAYEIDDKQGAEDNNAFQLQWALGF